MHVTFIVEGGPVDGMGHIYHSATIADALGSDTSVSFVTLSGREAVSTIQGRGYEPVTFDSTEELAANVDVDGQDTVVVDKPWIDAAFLARLRDRSGADTRIVVFGNRNLNLPGDVEQYCDVVVDFDIGSEPGTPGGVVVDDATSTVNLVGLNYFVLRDQFYEVAGDPDEVGELSEILLLFGGSDPSNLTTRALRQLLRDGGQYSYTVVLGPGFPHHEELHSLLDAHPEAASTVTILEDIDDVAARMADADAVLTSPGITLIESLATKTPAVAFYQNESQEIWKVYSFVHPASEVEDVSQLLDEAVRNFPTVRETLDLDIQRGRRRVLDVVEGTDPRQ